MIEEAEFELVEGTGNVFRDLEDPEAALKQTKAVLAADVIAVLDDCGFTVRKAGELTGFAASDFSRIRNANLGRFTIDRLMRMLATLNRVAGRAPVSRCRSADPAPEASALAPIIVDKSYVQGLRSLIDMRRCWCLLFPDAFFFEVASTDASARHSCLSKLRELHRAGSVHVTPNLGELLRKEILGLGRAGLPSENLIEGLDLDTFIGRFDELYEARREVLSRSEDDFIRDVDGLITKANILHGLVPEACKGTTEQRGQAYREARRTVARDSNFIARFFAEFVCRGDHAPPSAPFLETIARSGDFGPEWAIYRWVQVHLLYALELLEKHGQLDPEALTPNQRERFQHDLIDMEYVVLGTLQGALASKDKRMRNMFRELRPDGVVFPSVLLPR